MAFFRKKGLEAVNWREQQHKVIDVLLAHTHRHTYKHIYIDYIWLLTTRLVYGEQISTYLGVSPGLGLGLSLEYNLVLSVLWRLD